jgi:hypothetical protein
MDRRGLFIVCVYSDVSSNRRCTGASSKEKSLVAAAWAVAGHGAGAHAESGHEGRRDAVQRGAALVAAFLGSVAKAEPLSARGALRIQALNCSTRQGMHRSLLLQQQRERNIALMSGILRPGG